MGRVQSRRFAKPSEEGACLANTRFGSVGLASGSTAWRAQL